MGELEIGLVAGGFARLLASQISVRVLSFALNLLIARHLSPEAYGIANVQFHLITSTILLLSREGFRRGCLRFAPDSDAKSEGKSVNPWRVVSVAWLAVPAGLLVSACVCGSVFMYAGNEEGVEYGQAVMLHGVAAIVELLSEPFYILSSVELCFGLRAALDTAVLLTKSVATLVLLGGVGGVRGLSPLMAFSLAQLASAGVALIGYGMYGLRQLRGSRKPASLMAWGPIERDVFWMTGLFTLQAAEKQVLAEGSKLVMVTLQSSYNQGVYGLVSNLGSLVVRTLLQPLEEIAFAAFSRHRVIIDDQAGLRQLLSVLSALTKSVCILGLLSASFGPAYSYTALRLIYSTKWSETEAPSVLAAYSLYLLPLSINGVTEAFVHAVLDRKGLHQTNMLLIVFSLMHLGASAVAVTYTGAVGLVAADAFNMIIRVMTSMWFIRRFFSALEDYSFLLLLPTRTTLSMAAAAAITTLTSHAIFMPPSVLETLDSSRAFLMAAAPHIAIGGFSLIAMLFGVYKAEKATIQELRMMRSQTQPTPAKAVQPETPESKKEK